MEYSVLTKLPTPDLEELNSDAVDQLFILQNTQDRPKIDYWSGVSAMCNTILKERKNG